MIRPMKFTIAMDKLFPDMPGYRVHVVKVQQQVGVNHCGLFACAYITLLANGLDHSQYSWMALILYGQLKSLPSRLTGVEMGLIGQINSQIW
jgi:hypothetical protein